MPKLMKRVFSVKSRILGSCKHKLVLQLSRVTPILGLFGTHVQNDTDCGTKHHLKPHIQATQHTEMSLKREDKHVSISVTKHNKHVATSNLKGKTLN